MKLLYVAGIMTSSQISKPLGYREYSGSLSSFVMKGYYVAQSDAVHQKAVGGLLIVEYSMAGSEWQTSRQGRLVFYSAGWKDIRVSEEGTGMSYAVSFDSSNYNSFTITLTPYSGTLVYLRYKSAFNPTINAL